MRCSVPGLLTACLLAYPASAQAMIEVTRGPQADVFRTCMPTLVVANHTAQTIDFMQVNLVVRFRGGREAVAELKSSYRYGVLHPIAPGKQGILKLNPDEQYPLAAYCDEIDSVRAETAVCEADGKDCSAAVRLDVGRK
jgi:hypothetical protein